MTELESAPYEPPESLWQLVKSVANERELDVIKRVIGESLVETSLDLHAEIDTLLEIWRDYRNETLTGMTQMKQNKRDSVMNLPEPPNQRDTLKKEIQFFVTQLRETFKENGERFSTKILSNNHNLNVINYVLNAAQLSKTSSQTTLKNDGSTDSLTRPSSALNKHTGLETPAMQTSRSTSMSNGHGSRQRIRYRSESRSGSSLSRLDTPMTSGGHRSRMSINAYSNITNYGAFQEEIENFIDEDKINVWKIDEIVDHLR